MKRDLKFKGIFFTCSEAAILMDMEVYSPVFSQYKNLSAGNLKLWSQSFDELTVSPTNLH